MIEITEDITKIKEGIICHQVNCQNKIGAGISGAIIKKYPSVATDYHNLFNSYRGADLYGHYLYTSIHRKLTIASIFTQFYYGNPNKTGQKYTDEEKLCACLWAIHNDCRERNIYVPKNIGCGLGGGDWNKVFNGIKDIPNLYIVKLK